jgi:hypothetical protein
VKGHGFRISVEKRINKWKILMLCCIFISFLEIYAYCMERVAKTSIPSNGKNPPVEVAPASIDKAPAHSSKVQQIEKNREYSLIFIDREKGIPTPCKRWIPAAEDLPTDKNEKAEYILRRLLEGPTEEEKQQGRVASVINPGTKLVYAKVVDTEYGKCVEVELSEEAASDLDEWKVSLIHEQIFWSLIYSGVEDISCTKITVKGKALGAYVK